MGKYIELTEELALSANAGARAIENTKKYHGASYCTDIFSENPKEIPYLKAAEVLRELSGVDVPDTCVGKWIPVTERLPESEKIVLVAAKSKTFGYCHILMVAHIGHHEFTTEEYGWQEYEGETEYDEENDCFWIPECWYEVNSVEGNVNWVIDSDYDVTHWMPLPEPPKEGE